MDQIEGMKMGELLSSSFPIRSCACSLGLKVRHAVHDASPVLLRGGGRGGHRGAFAKLNVCTSIL